MDLSFTAEEQAFRDQDPRLDRRQPAHRHPATRWTAASSWSGRTIARWMKILSGEGWIAPNWEAKDGGPGFTLGREVRLRGRAVHGADAPRTVHFGTRMVGPVLLAYGTPEQRQKRYLPKILTSEEIWCQGYSEPGSAAPTSPR